MQGDPFFVIPMPLMIPGHIITGISTCLASGCMEEEKSQKHEVLLVRGAQEGSEEDQEGNLPVHQLQPR